MKLLRLFSSAGANGHVFLIKNGKTQDKGLAYSGFIGPMTTVAVVPTNAMVIPFLVEVTTKDDQNITVPGDVTLSLDPKNAVRKFDFTVDGPRGYKQQWQDTLASMVLEQTLGPIRETANTLTVSESIKAHESFKTKLEEAMKKNTAFTANGISFTSCSLGNITPDDEEIGGAIGAKEKEILLTGAEKALHDRRMKAATNDRSLKTYEQATLEKVETARSAIIEAKIKNDDKLAKSESSNIKEKFKGFEDVDARKLFAIGFAELAKSGRVQNFNMTSDLLSSITQAASTNGAETGSH